MTTLTEICIPMQRQYKNNKGLSERQIKLLLEKKGWLVWRTAAITVVREKEIFPTVRKKYTALCTLLEHYNPGIVEELQYYAAVHHGLPDFVCYRHRTFLFVECKFKNEQLSLKQKKCILWLQRKGFVVELHRFVDSATKTRRARLHLATGRREILAKQMRLGIKWKATSLQTLF